MSGWSEFRRALSDRPSELIGLLVLAALTISTYGFARPAAESLYIGRYGARALPWAWLVVGASAVVATVIYNHYVGKLSLRSLWPRVALVSAAVGGASVSAVALGLPHAELLLYVWKDLYIVVMVELFWSIASVSFALTHARWLYGMFLAAGTVGGFVAEIAVGWVANASNSLTAAAVSVPILIVCALMTSLLPSQASTRGTDIGRKFRSVFRRGLRVLRDSRYLILLATLVALVQVSVTVIDYQYSLALEAAVPNADERTQVGGQIYAAISAVSFVLQLLAGFIIKGVGVSVVIAVIPLFLLGGAVAFAVHPRFGVMALVKIASKAFDYSLGRASKELLYIPLTYEEKTEGKSIVDLLSYRVAKAGASLLLLWLGAMKLGVGATSALLGILLGLWLVVALVLGLRFRRDSRGRRQ